MIINFENYRQMPHSTIQASQSEVRDYIQAMLAELCVVAGQSGLQDIQSFLRATHQAIAETQEK